MRTSRFSKYVGIGAIVFTLMAAVVTVPLAASQEVKFKSPVAELRDCLLLADDMLAITECRNDFRANVSLSNGCYGLCNAGEKVATHTFCKFLPNADLRDFCVMSFCSCSCWAICP